jgi:hypothetical protein
VSSALAIAAVTAVLKDLLNNGFIEHDLASSVGTISVSALPPDLVPKGRDDASRLNLFLYQLTPNQGWRNVGLPSRDPDGLAVANPPLALDLHYMLTAYAAQDFHAEILLGYALQLLHETPVLSRDAIRRALQAPSPVDGAILPPAQQALSAADLADQVELVKLCPAVLGAEEMSRLWAAFQSNYRPTAAYQASVVLIESRRSTRSAPPVRTRTLRVLPFRQPVIDRVLSQPTPADPPAEGQPILAGHTLVLAGRHLRGDVTHVRLGELTVTPTDIADDRLTVPLTSPPFPAGSLRAGVHGLQVVHDLILGTPADPHAGFASNVTAVVLRPAISVVAASSTQVILQFDPVVGPAQRVVLFLNQLASGGAGFSFSAPARTVDASTITFDITRRDAQGNAVRVAPAGTYAVRAQVGGAESLLDVDAAGQYTGTPQAVIP